MYYNIGQILVCSYIVNSQMEFWDYFHSLYAQRRLLPGEESLSSPTVLGGYIASCIILLKILCHLKSDNSRKITLGFWDQSGRILQTQNFSVKWERLHVVLTNLKEHQIVSRLVRTLELKLVFQQFCSIHTAG